MALDRTAQPSDSILLCFSCRDGGSRAGTPFASDEATDGSALDVAQLQGLLTDAGASDRARLWTLCWLDVIRGWQGDECLEPYVPPGLHYVRVQGHYFLCRRVGRLDFLAASLSIICLLPVQRHTFHVAVHVLRRQLSGRRGRPGHAARDEHVHAVTERRRDCAAGARRLMAHQQVQSQAPGGPL